VRTSIVEAGGLLRSVTFSSGCPPSLLLRQGYEEQARLRFTSSWQPSLCQAAGPPSCRGDHRLAKNVTRIWPASPMRQNSRECCNYTNSWPKADYFTISWPKPESGSQALSRAQSRSYLMQSFIRNFERRILKIKRNESRRGAKKSIVRLNKRRRALQMECNISLPVIFMSCSRFEGHRRSVMSSVRAPDQLAEVAWTHRV
jgi:hypothetical protein